MPKRSRSGAAQRVAAPEPQGAELSSKRVARAEPEGAGAEPECLLHFHSPDALFSSLIAPISSETFFSEYWEKKPLHLKHRGGAVASFYRSLFRLDDITDLCKRHDLQFYRDVNVVRCVDGKKKVLNRNGKLRPQVLHKLITENSATVQLHQPQRFKDVLWQIQEQLESFFGALVGSNVYITPPDSQGLPAHYDDVEVFILQCEGRKHWRLYSPTVPLASDYSLVPDQQLEAPSHDLVLEEGDLLYFPRGTIHQANTPPVSTSTHLTISTFQKHSWSDLLLDLLPGLLADSSRSDVSLRQGLPRRILLSGGENGAPRRTLATHLRRLADRVERDTGEMSSVGLKRDFIMNRLPPYGPEEQRVTPVGRLPQLQDNVTLTFRDHMLLSLEPTQRTTDEAPEMAVFVLHSLRNIRTNHMMSINQEEPEEEPEEEPKEPTHVTSGLQFPMSHLEALVQLHQQPSVPVTELRLCGAEEQLGLVVALWSESLLKVI